MAKTTAPKNTDASPETPDAAKADTTKKAAAKKPAAKKPAAKKAAAKSTTAKQPAAKKAAAKSTKSDGAAAKKPAAKKSTAKKGTEPTQEDIARRAYEIHQQRGGAHGSHEDDWHRAEAELRGKKK